MYDHFWFDRLLRKARLPYPLVLAVVSVLLYGAGVALCALTGNLGLFLRGPRWILMSLFGLLNGTAVIYGLRRFGLALEETRSLSRLRDDEFRRMREGLGRLVTSHLYWIVVAFWILFSAFDIFIRQLSWWRSGISYNHPLLIDLYGFVAQGWNGCLLGGMFLVIIPINLNLVYKRICSLRYCDSEIATEEGIGALSSFKGLITANTLAAAVLSVLAIALWAKIPGKYMLYIPLFGSAVMFLPTAIIPHYLFHTVLSKARQERTKAVAKEIDMVAADKGEISIADLISIHKLLRKEARAEKVPTWLLDLGTIAELFIAALVSQLVSLVLQFFR